MGKTPSPWNWVEELAPTPPTQQVVVVGAGTHTSAHAVLPGRVRPLPTPSRGELPASRRDLNAGVLAPMAPDTGANASVRTVSPPSRGQTDVQVKGQSKGGALVGTVSPASAQSAPALGGRKLAVIVFNFANDTRQPWTPGVVRQRVFTNSDSTSAFFREESHDQLWLTGKTGNLDGDVYGYYRSRPPTQRATTRVGRARPRPWRRPTASPPANTST